MVQTSRAKREEDILKAWQDKHIFKRSVERDAPQGNFVFYEGPPTANAAPGVHHVESRSFKDIIPRFKTMQGYRVVRKAGWDTHGLPVELQVEKKLGLKSKLDIENIVKGDPKASIAKFNAECKDMVWNFKEEWEKLTARIGFWVDMDDPYITYENNYIESVWSVIKKANERGLLYQGHKVVPYCARCGTSLSSHEVALGYKNIEEDSIYVKAKVVEGKGPVEAGDYILTWTTTPWTLPGNVGLAVGPSFDYVKVKMADGQHLVLTKDLVEQALDGEHQTVAEFKGKDFVGTKYEPLFPGAVDAGDAKVAWEVVAADFVTTTDGTGVVHTAVMYGEDDYNLGEKVGLPKQHTVDLQGNFTDSVKGLAGMYVKDDKTTQAIYKQLESQGLLYRIVPYKHDYPFCWRCESPLLYYAKDSWMIAMTKLQKDLLKNAEKISWVPSHIKQGRFGEWLDGIKDWAISRERYWGTPLPVWHCQTGNSKLAHSASLRVPRAKSKGETQNSKAEEGCGAMEVVGSMAELEKLSGKKLDDLHRPFVDDVSWECKCGQTMRRTPEVMDVWLDSGSMPFAQYHYPFENQDLVDKKDGQFPANFISEAIDQTRGWFYTLLAVSTIMDKGPSYLNVICLGHVNDEQGKKMSKSKGNVVDPWKVIDKHGADALRWYLFTVNQPGDPKNFDVKDVAEASRKPLMLLDNVLSFYQLYTNDNPISQVKPDHLLDRWIMAKLNALIEHVTTQLEAYQVTNAARAIGEFVNELSTWYVRRSRGRFKTGDQQAVVTLGHVLLQLSKLLAPFVPFAAEHVYLQLNFKNGLESVHLDQWPSFDKKMIDQKLLDEMVTAQKIVEQGLAARAEAGIKIRQPLKEFRIKNKELSIIDESFLEIIKEELNIKAVIFDSSLEKEVELDLNITEELKLEGQARDVIRQINQLRKENKLTISERVIIYQEGLDQVFSVHGEDVKTATSADGIKSVGTDDMVQVGEGKVGIKRN